MTKWIALSGPQLERLRNTLVAVFDKPSLSELLLFRLGVNINNVIADSAWTTMVLQLVQKSQQEGWTGDLIITASEARQGHPGLEALKAELGIGKSTSPGESTALEAFVDGVGGLLNPEMLRTRLAAAEAAVCRVSHTKPNGQPYGGTGFLVGPDVMLTNHHVMRYIIDESVPAANVRVLFDYKLHADNTPVNDGNLVPLAEHWLIDSAKHSPTDEQALEQVPDTPADELDYALVRLAEPVGCRPVPSNIPGRDADGAAADDTPRGWIDVSKPPATVGPGAPLFILQHPEIGMMKLAWDPGSVIALNDVKTRIRHRTATLPGSSGSPCFDINFDLVALHHAGDPAESVNVSAAYNQAIPMQAITTLLEQRGLLDTIGQPCPAV